jgi:recombination protein RecA
MLFTFVVLILVINIFRFIYLGKKRAKSDGSDSGEDNMSKKDLALQQAMDQITSTFGKGSIMWLGRTVSPKNVPVVSTGSFALVIALGIFGLPKVSSCLLLFLHLNQHWTFCF